MFESVITAVLNKFLGDYVSNLAKNQLNLGIFSGNVVLENLQLKKEALDKLNLPIEVFFGHLGKLELHIPWRNLKTQPVKVFIEDLFLLAGPRVEAVYDAKLEEERAFKAKMEKIETAELFSTNIDAQISQDIKQESFTAQLVTKIVDNLQVVIKNIHVRYEDNTSNPERIFAVGVTLKGLSAVSTDAEWNETFLVNSQDAVNKLAHLDNLSVYWNTDIEPMQKLTYDEFVDVARDQIDSMDHSFILKPVSGTGKAILNKCLKEGIPKTLVDVLFDTFAINVNYEQYFDILATLASLSSAQRALPYRKYRPEGSTINSKKLFQYAVTCYLSGIKEKNAKRSWSYILQRKLDRETFVKLQSSKIINGGTLSAEDSTALTALEKKLSFDDLLHYRSLAKTFAQRSQASTPKGYGRWVLSWFGFQGQAGDNLIKDEDIQELYETIDFDANKKDDSDEASSQAQILKINFQLSEGSLSLSSSPKDQDSIVSLVFKGLFASFLQRPKTIALNAALKDLVLVENLVKESLFKELIKTKPSRPGSPTSEKPLLYLTYDTYTANPASSADIYVALRPLQIVVNTIAADKLIKFLLNKQTLPLLDALKAEAQRTFETIGIKTRANMQRALENHKGTDISLKVSAPVILIPEDPTDINKSLFVVDLGNLKANTKLVSIEEKNRISGLRRQLSEGETEQLHQYLYDKIMLKLSDLAVYFFENSNDWLEMAVQEFKASEDVNKILEKVSLDLVVSTCIISTAADLAKVKISGDLPQIEILLSDRKLAKAMRIIESIPKSDGEIANKKDIDLKPQVDTNGKKKKRSLSSHKVGRSHEFADKDEFYDAFDDMAISNSSEAGTEEFDQLLLEADFSIGNVVVVLSKNEMIASETMIASASITDLRARASINDTLKEITVCLGGIAFQEFSSSEPSGSYIINSAMEDSKYDFLVIDVQLVDPLNADFKTLFRSVERSVSVQFANLGVYIDPLRLYSLSSFIFKDLLPAVVPSKEYPTPHSDSQNTLPVVMQPKTELSLHIMRVVVSLVSADQRIVNIDAQKFVVDLSLSGKDLLISGTFSSLILNGLHSGSDEEELRKLLYFEGDSVAEFSYQTGIFTFPNGVKQDLLKLSTGKLILSYEPSIIERALKSLPHILSIVELAADSGNSRKSRSEKAAEELSTQSTKSVIQIDISLSSPNILIPSTSNNDVLKLSLGSLSILNEISFWETLSNPDQLFNLDLSDIYISLVSLEREIFLLKKFRIPLSARLTAEAMKRNYAEVEVDSKVEPICLELGPQDYQRLMNIVNQFVESLNPIMDSLPKSDSQKSSLKEGESDAVVANVKEQYPLDAKINIPDISLKLLNFNEKDKVGLYVKNITILCVMHTSRGLGLEIITESVSIEDLEDEKQPYNELFCIGTAAEHYSEAIVDHKHQLVARMDRQIDGDTVVNVYIESPRVLLLFDTVFFLQRFFTIENSKTLKKEKRPMPSSETHNSPSFTLLLNLLDASVLIFQEPKDTHTEVLALRLGSLSLKLDQSLSVALDEISLFVFNTEFPEDTKIDLIEDFAIVVALSAEEKSMNKQLEVNLNPLMITISFQDIRLIQSFLVKMQESQSRYLIKKSVSNEIASENSPVLSDIGSSEELSEELSTEKGAIYFEGLRIVVIDDSSNTMIPLCDASLENFSCSLNNWSTSLVAKLSALISANFYDPSLSYWEPLIEPWTFTIAMGKSDEEPTSKNVIILSSEEDLNIIAVQHSLERLLQMLKKLSVPVKKDIKHRKLSSPYKFKNLLNHEISIESEDNTSLTILPGDEKDFAFKDWKYSRGKALETLHKVSISVTGYSAIKNVSIDRDGLFKYKLEGPDRNSPANNTEFFLQLYLSNGVRHILFREAIVMRNKSDQKLCLSFGGDEGNTQLYIDGQSEVSIYSHLVTRTFSIGIPGESHQASDPLNLGNVKNLNGTTILLKNALFDCNPVNLLLTCEKTDFKKTYDMIICAPVVVNCLLPVACSLQFLQGENKFVHQFEANSTKSIYDIDDSKEYILSIGIKALGLYAISECAINSKTKSPSVLAMQTEAGRQLSVQVLIGKEGMDTVLTIAPFYVIINQTDLTVQLQTHGEFKEKNGSGQQIFTIEPSSSAESISMYSQPNPFNVKNRLHVRVADSSWSGPVSFESLGTEIEIDTKSMITSKWYNLSAFVSIGDGKYSATKIVSLSPRYFVVNDCEDDIEVKDSINTLSFASRSQSPIHFNPSDLEGIVFRCKGAMSWSSPFDVRNAGQIFLRDSNANDSIFRIGRTIRSPNFFITISRTDSWPYCIRNNTTHDVVVFQKNALKKYEIKGKNELSYCWDEPSFSEKRLVVSIGGKEHVLDPAEVGKKSHFKVKEEGGKSHFINVQVKANGPAVLIDLFDKSISQDDLNESDQSGSSEAFKESFQNVTLLKIPSIAISFVGKDLEEFLLVYLRGLEIRLASSKQFNSFGIVLKWFQIDNQCFDWDHPMLLYPSVLSKSGKDLDEHPFLSLGIIQSNDKSYGVTYFKYFGLLLQEMSFELGEELLRRIIDFANFSILNVDPQSIVSAEDLKVQSFKVDKDTSEVLFFEFLQLHPIKLNLTFSRTEDATKKSGQSHYNPLSAIVDVITMLVGNITDAPLKFNALVLENILSRQTALQETVINHYKQEGLSQIHKVLGSADFLGNPVGLFSTLGSGVTDLFYEPYQGFVSDRPQDIGIGFARGGISLVKKTISGFSGSLSKFTGSLAKGLSAATLDSSYQQRRRTGIARNKPQHALSGVSTGAIHLYSGVKSGITGIVDKPLEGAREGGIGGFFKGVGVGLVGVVTKPLVGVFDMTTSMTEGIKSSADDNSGAVTQVRFPRVVPWDGKIRPYDLREAFGQSILLNTLGDNSLEDEKYVEHLEFPAPHERMLAIITTFRILFVSVDRLKITWQTNLVDVKDADYLPECILIRLSSKTNRVKIIPVADEATQKWFVDIVNSRLLLLSQ